MPSDTIPYDRSSRTHSTVSCSTDSRTHIYFYLGCTSQRLSETEKAIEALEKSYTLAMTIGYVRADIRISKEDSITKTNQNEMHLKDIPFSAMDQYWQRF